MKYDYGTQVRVLPSKYHSQATDNCLGVVVGGSGEYLEVDIAGDVWSVYSGLVVSESELRYQAELGLGR